MTKKLSAFLYFDAENYFEKKILLAMQSEPLKNENQEIIGSKYTVIVWEDATDYGDQSISNIGDTYKVKVIGKHLKKIDSPSEVKLINPSGIVYGEFRNQLSVSAEDIIFITKDTK
ncbi:hypothetical protein LMV59_000603 [Listeria monocytogenes]|nr:hypothetical protein [Listeria monocytogenes]EBD1567218.1 hypothetical protein [Listeria monocytogenes]EIM2036651.1 hypothetical protein [Listeria monocytogenes]EIM2364699.1 hypothetical protein [Listeria monocytogenes]